jgi:hypothetical protein
MTSSVIPRAKQYLEHNLNVLITGLHGTGKSESLFELARQENIKLKYYSCSTLDPYTDLVGVPVPRVEEDGTEYLSMVRPREIDQAEWIIFDEFNRGDSKTQNAIFEIIQFRSINGEPLPKLRCCWAAMNPPGLDYQVEDVDPALIDRFDVFVNVEPRPSVQYMSHYMPSDVARVLVNWWREQDREKRGMENYISPRRLMKIGLLWQAVQEVRPALPPWGDFDVAKLQNDLRQISQDSTSSHGGIGDAPHNGFSYTPKDIGERNDQYVKYLLDNPKEIETHRKVLEALKAVSSQRLVKDYGHVLSACIPSLCEKFLASFPSAKITRLKANFNVLPESEQQARLGLKNVLDKIEAF